MEEKKGVRIEGKAIFSVNRPNMHTYLSPPSYLSCPSKCQSRCPGPPEPEEAGQWCGLQPFCARLEREGGKTEEEKGNLDAAFESMTQ